MHLAQVPVNDVSGVELRPPGQWRKALGRTERPLGPAAAGWVASDDLYRAILDGTPYRVRGLVGFGANLLLSHADAARGAAALRSLEFHVQTDLYLTPTAAFADIVLPIASGWEREGLAVGFRLDQPAAERVQLRPAVVPPRGEARADIDVVFALATRLGLGAQFWDGNVDDALRHYLAPSGITPEQLRSAPRGVRYALETTHRKYRRNGFATPSGKLEIFSEALQAIGQPALPRFEEPAHAPARRGAADAGFPLILTSAKTPLYCHSQHRNLPRLRRTLPEPCVEMSPATAAERGIGEGDWVAIVTPQGRIRARARLVATLRDGVVGAQHGWWQACPELDLPGYDPLGDDGGNLNLVVGNEAFDPVSGAAPLRSYCCQIEKLPRAGADQRTARGAMRCVPTGAGGKPSKRYSAMAARAVRAAVEPVHVVLQPATRGVERIADGDVQILVCMVLAWFPVHHDRAPGNRQIDADVVDLAMAVVSVIGAQRHPAGGHAIPKLLEFLNPAPHLGLDGRRRFHATEGDLDVGWHVYSSWVALPYHSAVAAAGLDLDQCRAASLPGRIQVRSC